MGEIVDEDGEALRHERVTAGGLAGSHSMDQLPEHAFASAVAGKPDQAALLIAVEALDRIMQAPFRI